MDGEPQTLTRIDALVASEQGVGSGPMGTRQLKIGSFSMNPWVTLMGGGLLWGFAAVCMAAPETSKETLRDGQRSATELFTWLYIGSNGVWIFFLIALYCYYGHVKLGKDEDKPEFSDAAYFTMLFSAGTAVGLIFYGASEPMWHYQDDEYSNRYGHSGYLNDNEKAQWAINLTIYHWGVHGWVVYTLTGVLLGILSWRHGLPLTYRCCFWPLFGRATWGWMGDVLDSVTILGVVAGVCTSLGIGATQILTGMQRVNWVEDSLSEDETIRWRCGIIAVITLTATASVLSGVKYGIKFLSQLSFGMALFLLTVVLLLDNTWFLFNLMIQSFGFYLQWFTQIGWFTDAFGQLTYGEGRAPDAKGAHNTWMDFWTTFYWGWWIAWSPFIGTFVARISKGRTIRNVINFTITVPLLFITVWFCVFGGAGLRMDRRATLLEQAGTELYNNSAHFVDTSIASGFCYKVPTQLPCPGEGIIISNVDDCPSYSGENYAAKGGLSTVCKFNSKDSDGYWFDLMNQYHGLGPLLSGFTIFCLAIFFITSSDSGSMVVDLMANNGQEAHPVQKVFWSWTEGAVAIALLVAGGTDSLKALQSANIMLGVPITIFVCLQCLSLWRILGYGEDSAAFETRFWTLPLYGGIFDAGEWLFSLGRSTAPNPKDVWGFLQALFFPPLVLYRALSKWPVEEGRMSRTYVMVIGTSLSFLGCIMLSALVTVEPGVMAIAWFCYFCFCAAVTSARYELRLLQNIEGNPVEDALVTLFLYPQVIWQLAVQIEKSCAQSEPSKDVKNLPC